MHQSVLFKLVFLVSNACASDLFHVKSKITFTPDSVSDYFGYSVDFSSLGLHVGAPKAKSRRIKDISPGMVFKCPLTDLYHHNVSCQPLEDQYYHRRSAVSSDFFVNDMWFGATIATVPDDKLLICAPRVTTPYQDKHLLANGVCYIHSKNRETTLYPLNSNARQAFRTDGSRKEYGEYGSHLNYFAYGQSGMSLKVTQNYTIIIGAPGILQWTGAIVEYAFTPKNFYFFKGPPSSNPYYTLELGPDDYFGYSVESGIFEEKGQELYIGGAPRSKNGYGQVLVFEPPTRETDPLKIKAQLIGPQLGSYFGSCLCTSDLDGDGLSDLLVGAPNYAKNDGQLKYDQGAVFVFMSRKQDLRFDLQEAGFVRGSEKSGARFGSAIADLGDIDGDGFRDIAIGAPWEDDGKGAVYIYKGSENGLISKYSQRLQAETGEGFGMSVSKGYDADLNKCNDIAIGAHKSGTVYLYRGVPTIQIISSIKVPDAKNLKQNADNFTALFCVTVPPGKSSSDIEMKLKASVIVDPESKRANTLGEPDYEVTVKPGIDVCNEQVIEVNNQSDLSKPIVLNFDLVPVINIDEQSMFPDHMARISENSNTHSSFLIQLLSDCGEDLICNPWLQLSIESLQSPYIPGSDNKVGAKIVVTNIEEPAYSVKLHVSLPHPPKRLLSSCSVEHLLMTCDLPAPLRRNQSAEWVIELEYNWEGSEDELRLRAVLEDPVYLRNISDGAKELVIPISPRSTYNFSGKPEPNGTISITRETFDKNGDIFFSHYYEVKNHGPSDYHHVEAVVFLPSEVTLANAIEGMTVDENKLKFDIEKLVANAKTTYVIPLRYDLSKYGGKLEETIEMNMTTRMYLILQNYHASPVYNISLEVTTTLKLEPKTPIWPIVLGSLAAGILLLAAIILGLYKFGFFSRAKKDELKQLLENNSSQGSSNPSPEGHSAQELLETDSD